MTFKQNIKAILECYFAGFKDEIIDSCCNRIYYEYTLKERAEKISSEELHYVFVDEMACEQAKQALNRSMKNMSEQERWKKGL